MAFTTNSTDPEKIKEVVEATEKRRKKDAIVEKLQEKKRRIEKTAKLKVIGIKRL